MDNQPEYFGKSIFEMQDLDSIKKRPDILAKIKLEVTPKMVMEPRFHSRPEDVKKAKEISGYMFYIESLCSPPALMVMKVGRGGITVTIGKIDEIPSQLLQNALDHPVHPPVNNMYAITDEIKTWLKKELKLTAS